MPISTARNDAFFAQLTGTKSDLDAADRLEGKWEFHIVQNSPDTKQMKNIRTILSDYLKSNSI